MRTPMPILEQIEVLRSYLRTLQADCNRAMRESGAHYRKRRVCPFAEELRWRRMQHAWELRDVGNACLDELRHARVLSIADFLPGDQITMEVVLQGHGRSPERYLISDVIWSKRDKYHYEVWRLTKGGRLFERGGQTWLTPSTRIRIAKCEDVLPEETRRQCAAFRAAQTCFLKEPGIEATSNISSNGSRSDAREASFSGTGDQPQEAGDVLRPYLRPLAQAKN